MDDGTDRSKTTFLRLQELPHLASDEESASNHHRVLISSGSVSSEISLRIPFDQSDESELKWLLEEYPQTPFSLLRAKEVTKTLDWYMKNLATQVEDSGIFSRLGDLEVSGTLEIRVEALEDQQNESHGCLQAIHWEVLEDRRAWSTHVLKFETIQVLRIVQPLQDGPNCDVQMSQDSIRILFVCARHSLDDSEDISSRLLMDPIFEIIDEAKSKGRNTTAEVLRLGSFDAFTETLGNHPPAYFSAVHFDCHGWVSNETAHLDFVRVSGETHSVSALEVASCLRKAGVSVANLNACSSAATGAGSDSNLALCFTRSGISMTIAMSYDILDAASSVFEQEFYKFWLLDGVKDPDKKSKFSRFGKSQPILPNKVTLNESVCRAVQKARKAMRERDNRVGAGGWEVNLKDHIVPVIYAAKSKPSAELDDPSPSSTTQPHSSDLEPGPERKKWLKKIRSSISNIPVRPRNETMPSLQPEYRLPAKKIQKLKNTETMYSSLQPKGFRFNYIDPPIIGRDRAVAEIEAAVVQSHRKVTFIEGRAGSGKSILVRHICDWWKSTCYIEDFFYFDCRRYAILEESHDYSRDINGPCTAETQDMMQLVEHFLFSSMFPDEVSNSLFRLKGTTKEQKKKTRDKLRSGRYLLVFDNADFRMHEKDGMMTPMKALTIGSLLMCRDSAMKSATAVASIQSFIRDIHTGNSLVIVSARYKKWYQDYLPDVEAVMYSIPKLTLSSCLTIGERKLQQIRASDELCNYPGSTEDFAFLIDVLQNNPLAIELVYSSIIRKQLKPNAAYIQLCTEAMELDEKDALMAYAGAGRFVTELKAMANLDWHNGADESRLPFSMFWMADHAGYLPTEDGGIYWYTVIRRFYEMTRLLNTDWGNLTDPYGLNLGSNEEEIKNSILQPHSEQDIKRIVELIRVPDQALRLCRLMADLGLVEEEQNSDFIQVSTMAVLAQSKFLVHPLFPLIARGGCFGDSDTIHVQNLQMQRHTIFLRYTLTRYQFLFYKQFSGGQSSVADYATGKSQNLDLIGSATKKLLETASNELPSLLATLSWIVNSPAETTEAMIIISKSLTGIISPLGQLWRTRREMVVPFSEVLGKVFKRFLVFLQENSDPPDALLVKFTVQQAIRLAGMSSYRTGSPSATTYLDQARNLIERYQKAQGKLAPGMQLALFEADALEASNLLISGDRERAVDMLNNLLTRPTPQDIPSKMRTMYLHPALLTWLTSLKIRKHSFPSQHVLLQMKQPLLEIIQNHEVSDPAELKSFNDDIQGLLRRTLYDIIGSGSLFPLPPRNKNFNTNLLKFTGYIGGETVAAGMDTGVSTLDPTGATSEAAEITLSKAFVTQSNVAGSSGLAAMHMRIAQYFMGCGQWREVLRHLKAYSMLPVPHEDRLNAGLRSQNALMACLSFSKLHCYEKAREHAFKAIEEAVEAKNDGSSLAMALGAFAGIEAGRTRRYSIIPKLLLLNVLDVTYSTSPPHQNTGVPSESQLKNRKGDILILLAALVPHLTMSWAFQSMTPVQRQEFTGRQFPGMKSFEAQCDNIIVLVRSDLRRKQEEARAGRKFWMDRSLEVELYTEAEQLLFAKEMPYVKHFADSAWARTVLAQRKLEPTRPFITATELDLPSLRKTIELSSGPLSFDPEPPSADDQDSDDSSSSDDDSVPGETVTKPPGWTKFSMFADRFMEYMIDRSLRRGAIPESAWQKTGKMLAQMEGDGKLK